MDVSDDGTRLLPAPGGSSSAGDWTKDLLLAKDCHAKNLVIFPSYATQNSSGTKIMEVFGRVCTDIEEGAPILAWFSDEMASAVCMPFLGLSNIKGTIFF
jgi:hypothetical protein